MVVRADEGSDPFIRFFMPVPFYASFFACPDLLWR